ncbi:probable serine/threonine-protein kinase MARK-A isoform X2 [Coccinella septempunctata]|uniref:probable serine/threonine-protein kinase MARK-A isoform X2 n=1 Tax=Coccinella septempunctata TaxID=41139 RepID=UPI001D090DE9|nr:probable serine/threonine-protein kinase MARK-A isoform X2 [Coccinella septempunctata]
MTVKMTSAKSRCVVSGVVFLMTFLMAQCVPLDFTTSRSLHFEPAERPGNQLMEIRKSSDDLVLDTRTPPKVRAQTKKKEKDDNIEYSHAGVAIPVDEDSLKLEETTKKLNFYKVQRPTTNSGISTWILLSGDASSTTPKVINTNDTEDTKIIEVNSGTKIVKPVFKKRTTTSRPTQTTTAQIKAVTENSSRKQKPTPLVKIKASTLNNAKKKNDTKTIGTSIKEVTQHPTEKTKVTLFNRLSSIKTTTEKSNIESSTSKNVDKTTAVAPTSDKNEVSDSQHLTLEGKEGDANITEEATNNKKKKNKTKKNKNKNRRKKPQEKTSNSTTTKVTKNKKQVKEKPIGTQIYNYLSREMMPTLGVGLVGLMVTAGLASYFLYPFGAARRIYEVDRKDKEGAYYYNDIYSGGIAEEEAFGKVIAGMPLEKLQSSMYSSTQTTRRPVEHKQKNYYPSQQNFANHQNHHVSQNTKNYHRQQNFNNHHNKQNGMVQGTVESVPVGSNKDSYLVNSYSKDSYQLNYKNNEVDSTKDHEQKFVVGNAPKGSVEEITPVAVPEHGPRMLKIRRRRRDVDVDDMENDIYSDKEVRETSPVTEEITEKVTTSENKVHFSTTEIPTTTTIKNTTEPLENKVHSVVELIKDIFHLKINLGLELVKNATRSISNYIEKVQTKLDRHYRTSHR